MQQFNAVQYLAIDIANQYGLDKLTWDERIQWVKDNTDDLEQLVPEDNKTKYLYLKAVNVFRNLDKPTGFTMALDATASGVQVMAALGKCGTSALACNLINTGKREDLYSTIMNKATSNISRDKVKEAVIPMMYGSKAAPRDTFGEGTPELKVFLQAVEDTVPILAEMQGLLDACWNSSAEYHSYSLPDGHVVVLPTMVDQAKRVEVFGTSYTYHWKEVGTDSNTTSLLANVN